MKISIYTLILSAMIITSCSEKTNEDKKDEKKTEEPADEIKEEVKMEYQAFDSALLQGNWKVIDAQAYSKDKMMGQVYSFNADTAVFFKNTGDAGMTKGPFTIENGVLIMKWISKDKNGTSTISFDYEGGFFEDGKKLQLNANDMMVTLEKQ
jgi:hypothetical protein